MIALLLALNMVLAPVSVRPEHQNLQSFGGGCKGSIEIVVPANPQARKLQISISDGTDALSVSEMNLDNRVEIVKRSFSVFEGGRIVISAWITGERDRVLGSAIGVVNCA